MNALIRSVRSTPPEWLFAGLIALGGLGGCRQGSQQGTAAYPAPGEYAGGQEYSVPVPDAAPGGLPAPMLPAPQRSLQPPAGLQPVPDPGVPPIPPAPEVNDIDAKTGDKLGLRRGLSQFNAKVAGAFKGPHRPNWHPTLLLPRFEFTHGSASSTAKKSAPTWSEKSANKFANLNPLRGLAGGKSAAAVSHSQSTSEPVRLATPPEIYEPMGDEPAAVQRDLRRALPQVAGPRFPAAATNNPGVDPLLQVPPQAELARQPLADTSASDRFVNPFPGAANMAPASRRPLDLTPDRATGVDRDAAAGPSMGLPDPTQPMAAPALQATPTAGIAESASAGSAGLKITNLAICNEVRSFEDYSELDRRSLVIGQPILIYAAIANQKSLAYPEGYRTLTLSTLEIRTPTGELISRQPLGTAADLTRSPRSDYFLTHHLRIPEKLPPGDYVFQLGVHDLNSRQTSQAQLAVRVTEGRNRLDETGDTAKFATRPANTPR